MSDIMIRPARADDAAAFEAVVRAAYGPWIGRLEGLPDVSAGIAGEIADHHVWLASTGEADTIVGGIVLHVSAEEARIANLAVHPDCGGRGIGRALMGVALAAAHRAGHRRIALATHRDMTPTLRFYRNDGWEEVGREGVRIFMEKPLE
ncbi:GNAT family N-acetyltransferase [Aliiruegeria haliotis]|nr:GNAT family N-acetyltransferase [Aliiruegeria haliotis]